MHQNVFLQLFNPRFNSVPYGEVVVRDEVDQEIEEAVRRTDFILPEKRFDGAKLMDLLLGHRNNKMPAQENIQGPKENFFVVKPDAVYDDKIVVLVYFNFGTLLLFAEAILNGKIMQEKRGCSSAKSSTSASSQ